MIPRGREARRDSADGVGVSVRRGACGIFVVRRLFSERRRGGVGSTGMSRAASCGLASGARMRGMLGERTESGARVTHHGYGTSRPNQANAGARQSSAAERRLGEFDEPFVE